MERLLAAFPATQLDEKSRSTWESFIADLPQEPASEIVDEVILNSTSFPTIAAIRRPLVERSAGIPSAEEAYASLAGDGDPPHALATLVRDRLGGPWAYKTTDEPGIWRHNFPKAYAELREEELRKMNVRQFRQHRAA